MQLKYTLNNWMSDISSEIKNKKFRHICIPATHDSGTCNLSESQLFLDKETIDNIYNALSKFPEVLPPNFLVQSAGPAINGLSTATSKSIKEQLNEGIRGLDLRILLDTEHDEFHIYHGLMGPKLSEVIEQIKDFLSNHDGEILYVIVGHYRTDKGAGFSEEQYKKFVELFKGLEPYLFDAASHSNFFELTYEEIIGDNTSRIIIVDDYSPTPYERFWPGEYSTIGGKAKKISGSFADTTEYSKLIQDQQHKFKVANDQNLPFALSLQLTPQEDDVIHHIIASMASALAKLGPGALVMGVPGFAAFMLSELGAAGLAIYGEALPWDNLKELSHRVNGQLDEAINSVQSNSDLSSDNKISIIYVDYYEDTYLVDLAIARTLGLKETNAVTKNPDGHWRKRQIASFPLNGFVVSEQGNYGIVDVKGSYYQNNQWGFTDWCTNNPDGKERPPSQSENSGIIDVKIREQGNYGIIDLQLKFHNSHTAEDKWDEWITKNGDADRTLPVSIPAGGVIQGMQVKEQGGYGIVDIKFFYTLESQ